MNKTVPDCLTERHLLLFGAIIQWFARYEVLMQEVMATVAGSEPASVMLLTRGLNFSRKRQALLDLLRHRPVPLDRYDRVLEYLRVPHALAPLRDDIAHSTWVPSQSPHSIQPDWILRLPPRVKPMRGDPGPPGEGLAGLDPYKDAYTLDDFGKIVETLGANHARFSDYLREVGLIFRHPK